MDRRREVTDQVFESPGSMVFEQAKDRLHTIRGRARRDARVGLSSPTCGSS
jgi:hypothetical protein